LFEKILLPLDGTPAAETGLAWASAAASRCGASLELLTVVENTQHEANGHVQDAETYLRTQQDRLAEAGVTVSSHVAVGALGEEIVSRAAGAGLTVMTYPTSRWRFGGALDLLLKDMVNPVVVVRGHEGQAAAGLDCPRILAPIGPTAQSRAALPFAIDLCGMLDASLVLCNIVSPIPGAYDKKNPPPDIARDIEDLVLEAEQMVAALGIELGKEGIAADSIIRVGEPAREIIAAAREVGAGLIAMATRGSDSMSRVMASVALGVVQASPIPCLLVRQAPQEPN